MYRVLETMNISGDVKLCISADWLFLHSLGRYRLGNVWSWRDRMVGQCWSRD